MFLFTDIEFDGVTEDLEKTIQMLYMETPPLILI